jgi:hypothetical protein
MIFGPPTEPISDLAFPGMVQRLEGKWLEAREEEAGVRYTCGFCGADVGPSRHYRKDHGSDEYAAFVYLCPVCNRPTYICKDLDEQAPGRLVGGSLVGITDPDVERLYGEARKALASGAPSASVMVCRKLLMHIAVEKGAEKNEKFAYYALYLLDQHIIGEPLAEAVKHIKNQGNKENHELDVSLPEDATALLKLVEFVLASIYELPALVPKSATQF